MPANGQNGLKNEVLHVLQIANDSDVAEHSQAVQSAELIELNFPAFSDGRAFSQAVQLRKRLGFKGDIRATGDVLVDQLVQMQRSGFTSAVLREDQSAEHGKKLLAHYSNFYQGDVANPPAFTKGLLA
ncbi:MAG: DUF934 domain-containing protein [Brachymonas sp.]|nr:DUF934 domain-containing protein [Brachymonas sp.]